MGKAYKVFLLAAVVLLLNLQYTPNAFARYTGWVDTGKADVQCWGALPPLTSYSRLCGNIDVAAYTYSVDSQFPSLYHYAGAFLKDGYTGEGQDHPSVSRTSGTWEGYQDHCKKLYTTCCTAAEDGECRLRYNSHKGSFIWPKDTGWTPPGN